MSIKLSNINYTYMSGTPYAWQAIKNLSLEIEPGTITGIVGNTGAGKSTLLKLLAGLLEPDQADGGETVEAELTINGLRWESDSDALQLRRMVGLAFQFPEQQLFAPTVREDILYGADNYAIPSDEALERLSQLLEAFGLSLEQYGKQSPFALSGGEQRKVVLAGILIYQPELILLDEPFAGLDMAGVSELTKIIKELRAAGRTIIIISHSMERLAGLVDQLVIMKDGSIIAADKPLAIFAQPDLLAESNLELPEITKLIKAANTKYDLAIPLDSYELMEIEEYLKEK